MRNIRFGSKKQENVFSGLLTRTVYFSEHDERQKYTVRVKKPENVFSCFSTRAVYFNELDEREKYTFRVKKPENAFSVFDPSRIVQRARRA